MPALRPRAAHGIWFALLAIALVGYPLLAVAALERWSPRVVGCLWLGLAAGGWFVRRRVVSDLAPSAVAGAVPGVALLLWAALLDAALPLRLLPAVVNATLAGVFLGTLRDERSMIEVGARLIQPRLPDFTRPYCRLSTVIWALFFVASALWIGWFALFASQADWTAVTTRGYFAAMALLGVVEFFVRKIYFRHYDGGPVDALFAAIFPAENTEMGRRSAAYIAAERAAEAAPDLSAE